MSNDSTPDAMMPPIRSIPPHAFVNVEAHSFCGQCGAGDAHPIHITSGVEFPVRDTSPEVPEEEYKNPVPSTYADLPGELSRMLHLVMDAVDEQPQSLRGPESLLHKAAVLAWMSMEESLREIAGATHKAEDHLGRIADALERWVP